MPFVYANHWLPVFLIYLQKWLIIVVGIPYQNVALIINYVFAGKETILEDDPECAGIIAKIRTIAMKRDMQEEDQPKDAKVLKQPRNYSEVSFPFVTTVAYPYHDMCPFQITKVKTWSFLDSTDFQLI